MEQVRKPAKKTAEDQTLPKSSSHIVLTGAQDNNLFHYNKPLSSTQKKLKTCFHLMFFNRQSRFILQGSFSIRQIQNLGEPHEYGYSRMKGSHGYGYFRIEGPHGYGYPVVKKLDGDIQGSHGFQIFGYFGQAFTSIRAGWLHAQGTLRLKPGVISWSVNISHFVMRNASKRPPRERDLLGKSSKKVALVKNIFIAFLSKLLASLGKLSIPTLSRLHRAEPPLNNAC